jgi:DNA polymerase eta
MSSPSFQTPSQDGFMPSSRTRKSRFTYNHLKKMASYSTATPLRTIAHIDLDAFYAQCEMVRNNVPEDQPLAVQQWQGLIAINYPARKFGLGRHISATEAKKLCPEIILQHVATFKEGEDKWAYRDDAEKHMSTHKVCLDPYRLESRRVLATIKEALPPEPLQRVEKAGIDEVFLDLTAHVHSILLERYPELKGHPPYNDPTENLPWPTISTLDWGDDNVVELDANENEEDDPDWDDVCLSIASEIARHVRRTVREKLKYTMSGGISRNKMLSKLGSAHKKPNFQSVIRTRAIQSFLGEKKFTKIRMLGGKLGDDVVANFQTDSVKELLQTPLEQFQNKLGDDTGAWLYDTIRGHDNSEVSSRTQIKSMLSAKAFRPAINSFDQGIRWIRIFAADLFGRCVEDGVLENKRRPKTISLHHNQSGTTRSKQLPIPIKQLSEDLIFELGKNLLAQTVADGRVWPCINLSLSLTGFQESVSGNMGIKGFFVPEDDIKEAISDEPLPKRQKTGHHGIQGFFNSSDQGGKDESPETLPNEQVPQYMTFRCEKCNKDLPITDKDEHMDWHFAKELNDEFRRESEPNPTSANAASATTVSRQPKPNKSKTVPIPKREKSDEKGQMKLNFGHG